MKINKHLSEVARKEERGEEYWKKKFINRISETKDLGNT